MTALAQTPWDRLSAPATLEEARRRAKDRRERFSIGLSREDASVRAGEIIQDLDRIASEAERDSSAGETIVPAWGEWSASPPEDFPATDREQRIMEAASRDPLRPDWLLRRGGAPVRSTQDILRAVARQHGVALAALRGPRRTRDIVRARFEAAYWLCRLTDDSLGQIGKAIGKDHTTALNAIVKHAVLAGLPQMRRAMIRLGRNRRIAA